MPDSKITALTSISTSTDPANDPLVIVDVSDTSMAATGTTKKVTLNQLLGASGTATLASATITGDLTVDTNVLKVDSANNRVGVNNASPTNPLNVTLGTHGSAFNVAFDASGNARTGLFAWSAGSSSGAISGGAEYTGSSVWTARSTAASFVHMTSGEFQFFGNTGLTAGNTYAPSELMRLNSTGLGVGVVPSAGKGALQLSSGINFPATQVASTDPNTLDDYEEGTWTGTLTGATTNPTTPVTATGRYTKIGRQVSIQIQFTNVDTTGASGQIKVTGAPFTNNSSVSSTGAVLLSSIGTFTGSPAAFIGVSTTEIELYASSSGGVAGLVTHNAGASRSLYINLTYTV